MEPEPNLNFGIAFHCGMQVFYNPVTWDIVDVDEKLGAAIEAFIVECESQKKLYLERHKLTELSEEMEDEYLNALDLGAGMFTYHAAYVHPKFDNWFRPVMVEIPFEVPLVDPDGPGMLLRCTNSPQCGQTHSNDHNNDDSIVVYGGRVDALVEDINDGGYYLFDWKTAALLSKNDEFLNLDDQFGGYCWALLVKLNLDIRGFVYAETRKDFPRNPRLLKRMHRGCIFSTVKTQATTIEIFEPYVAKHDPVAFANGNYDEYLDFLRSAEATQFSNRMPVMKSDVELEAIGHNISVEAADMVQHPRIYPNISRFHCNSCKYRQPCIGEFRGEHLDLLWEGSYIQTDRRHWMEERRLEEKEEVETEL
jgi:hypothetical protein